MRTALFATTALLASLTACGGPETSQANNSQANISTDAATENAAVASAVVPAGTPVGKEDAARIMHERHEGMEAIGKATKTVRRELEGGSPNLATVRESAAKLEQLAQQSKGWFPAGTGPDVGKTGAKPEIWQKPEDFSAKENGFVQAAKAFKAAAAGNDLTAINAAFANLGKSCKACHDSYRKEMKH
jgi:cytochrome c556